MSNAIVRLLDGNYSELRKLKWIYKYSFLNSAYIIFTILTLFCHSIFAQDLEGTIVDAETNDPLIGATIKIESTFH